MRLLRPPSLARRCSPARARTPGPLRLGSAEARQWPLLCPAQHAMSGLARSARAARPPAQRRRLLRTPTAAGVFAGRARCVHGLSHVSPDGQTPRMVDVSKKNVTLRTAVARSEVELPPHGEDPSPFTTPPRLTQTAPLPAQWRARCSGRTGRRRWYHGARRSPSSTRAARRAPSCTCPHPTLSPLPLPSNLDHLPAAGCEQDDGDYRGRAGRQAHLRAHPLLPPPTRNPLALPALPLPPSR